MSSPQTPQEAVIAYYDKNEKFETVWNFLSSENEIESYEVQALLIQAAETAYNSVNNKQKELEKYAAKLEGYIAKFQWSTADHVFTKDELKSFLDHCKSLWKRLRRSLQDKLEDAWEVQSQRSALMDVFSKPTRSSSAAPVPRQNPSHSVYITPVNRQGNGDGNGDHLKQWIKLAEQKDWGKALMSEWKSQNVLDALSLEDITDEVLQEFKVQKLQRVVLLKWKRQVIEGTVGQRYTRTPSRSADRYSRQGSVPRQQARRPPASHLYRPGPSLDRRYPSRTPRYDLRVRAFRQVRQSRGGHLSELFAHFDKGTGWVDQTKLHELMFATLLVHRRRIIDSDPNAPMLSKAEIRPLVNGLVWEVMKQVDLERSGYLTEPEYVKCANILIAEFEKVVAKVKNQPEDSDESDEEKNDRIDIRQRQPLRQFGRPSRSLKRNMLGEPEPISPKRKPDRKIGEQLMIQVVKLCKAWNQNEGSSLQLVEAVKESVEFAELQLRKQNESNV